MIVFLIGIKLPPAVVGEVIPNSPAAAAGLKPGDEIIEISGKSKNLDFSNISIAAALSDVNEPVQLKVRHENGSTENYAIVAKYLPGMTLKDLKDFGILQPVSLTIAKVSDPNKLKSKTGLLPGDKVVAVNGKEVQNFWELQEIVENSLAPEVTLLAERADRTGEPKLIEVSIRTEMLYTNKDEVKSEADLSHIYSMVPRLRVLATEKVSDKSRVRARLDKIKNKIISLFGKAGAKQEDVDAATNLQIGDVILAIGGVENPTYKDMRDVTTEYEGRKLPIKVLRTDGNGVEKALMVTVEPKRPPGSDKVLIGILPVLDGEHPVIAKTISIEGVPQLEIPRGSTITAVDGVSMSNFYDVIREIRKYPGQRITIDWRIDAEIAGDVALNVNRGEDSITVKSALVKFVPFEDLKRVYKATGPVNAVVMGYRKTVMFITQTYLTLKCIIAGMISPKIGRASCRERV